jgi:alpha-tubulin suppressor-like RCC1 family protein/type II secretory pathway pseudopilin PulG
MRSSENIKKKYSKNPSFKPAFTIVELIIVIIIIVILAAITIVSYSNWRQYTVTAQLKSDLGNAYSAMENYRTFNNSYPTSVPSTFTPSSGVTMGGGSADGGSTYCISAVSSLFPSIYYHIDSLLGNQNPVPGICAGGWKMIAGNNKISCAISMYNQSFCWGYNQDGEIGNSQPIDQSLVPMATDTTGVLNGKTITSITAGYWHVCAIASDNNAYCWGYNSDGELGNNDSVDGIITHPVAVNTSGVLSGKTITAISAGQLHTCVIASDNNAYCWGANASGQLGNNSTTQSLVPVAVNTSGVLSGKTVKAIATGYNSTCVIASDNNAYCWGDNGTGELGNNSTTQSNVPVAVNTAGVLSGKTIKSIAINQYHTCAIASDNQAYCWGRGNSGELGNNASAESNVPVAVNTSGVLSGKTVTAIAVGRYHSCAIASDSRAYCWGLAGSGQLGNNSTTSSLVPVAVDTTNVLNGKTITGITAGLTHTCAISSDNQSYCWGDNSSGDLGNNSTTQSLIPVSVYY